jgi:arylsulfatase A-like enzyme/tetratricopeptide (TPR) repeat protein
VTAARIAAPALLVAAWLAAGVAPRVSPGLARAAGSRAPNVLLVTIDTLRVDRVGAYGSRRNLTPVIDRLAADGVLFERAVVQVPLTRPSHACILTGKLPFQTGIRDNLSFPLGPEHRTLAELLQERGFATGGFVAAFMLNAQSGLNRGFQEFDDDLGAAAGASAFLAEHQRRAAGVERRAGAWIERAARGDRPFFAWVHFYDPHSPYDPPAPYAARYASQPYDGEVAYTDAVLGRLLARLDRLRLRDQTLVIVTADHGEGLGEHGEAEHGFFLYDTTLHVPLVMRWPAGLPAGVRADGLARSIDLVPTILDLVGARDATPAGLAGRSLAGSIPGAGRTGAADVRPKPDATVGDVSSYAETLFPRLYFDCADLRAVRSGGWKYVEAPRPELYDLQADPGERVNLFAREGQRARALRSRLLDALGGSLEAAIVGGTGPAPDAEARRRLASLGYVSGSGGTGGQADPKDMVADFQAFTRRVRGAFQAYDRGQFDLAAKGFEAAVSSGRAAFDIHYYLGSAYLHLGQPGRAVAPLRDAVRKNPAYTPSSIQLASALLRVNRRDEAIVVLREALDRNPRDASLHAQLGYAARLGNDRAGALREYEAARALDPNDFDTRMSLSSLYRDGGDPARALHEVEAAIALRPTDDGAHNQAGMLLGGSGRFAEAAAAFERATRIAPRNAQHWYNLGLAWLKAGRRAEAASALRQALVLQPGFEEARALLAQASAK